MCALLSPLAAKALTSTPPCPVSPHSTPDYLTPQDQCFKMDYEPSTMQLDEEVGLLSPRAMKRPRPLAAAPSGK